MKQLEFDFGDYNEERILDTVKNVIKEELGEEFNKLNLTFIMFQGDEMLPFKTVFIDRENASIICDGHESLPTVNNLGRIILDEKNMRMFREFEGEKVLKIVSSKAKKIAKDIKGKIWH